MSSVAMTTFCARCASSRHRRFDPTSHRFPCSVLALGRPHLRKFGVRSFPSPAGGAARAVRALVGGI